MTTKADLAVRAKELGITTTLSGPTGAAIAQLIATERLVAAMEKLGAQQDEDGPRIDETLRLTAVALKVA